MDKTFEWGGKTYKLPRLRLAEMKDYLTLAESMGDDNNKPSEQLEIVERMLGVLHCPPVVQKVLYADQAQECIQALERAHFGEVGGDSGNVETGGAQVH